MNAKQLFLLDGVGAVVTALMLGVVLTTFQSTFGMPTDILVGLALIAAGFAAFSLTCHFRDKGPAHLLVIAAANSAYCVVTLGLVLTLHEDLTWLGMAYFLGEIVIILGLVALEVTTARRQASEVS